MSTNKMGSTINFNIISIFLIFFIAFMGCKDKTEKKSAIGSKEKINTLKTSSNDSLSVGKFKIGESKTEGNLQVFLIHGDEELGGKKYTTLASAMEQKKVRVTETGSVNELSIDNNGDSYVFIHSGDIVKGGKQDRTIAQDVIIKPGTKNVPLESFCVEQGRWQQREGENVSHFESNSKMLSSRKLKLAAKYDKNQGEVWRNVADEQVKLKDNISKINGQETEVKSEVSATSLQLTLESKELEKVKKEMENSFLALLKNNTTAIGYAYAINGEIHGVDVYNNKALFKTLWHKIAESIMTESVSNLGDEDFTAATSHQVADFIASIDTSEKKETTQVINEITALRTIENTADDLVFSTIDKEENKWVHTNYMRKDKEAPEDRHQRSIE